jgi:hypothetical protein
MTEMAWSHNLSSVTTKQSKTLKKFWEDTDENAGYLAARKKAISDGLRKYHKSVSATARLKRNSAISVTMKKVAELRPDLILKRKTGFELYWENIRDDPVLYTQKMESLGKQIWGSGTVIDAENNLGRYCEKWKDVNPRVHAFFDRKCVECGVPENGRSHIGHHVFYVKEACCLFNDDGIYYTNLNCKEHPEHNYFIGENPNYFVILCPTCHGRTNGNFENRKKWADHFKELIDTKYNGKCYFTKEEMQ